MLPALSFAIETAVKEKKSDHILPKTRLHFHHVANKPLIRNDHSTLLSRLLPGTPPGA
jgi:uncharacterized protein Yka (UPF0111/DUF47 family)